MVLSKPYVLTVEGFGDGEYELGTLLATIEGGEAEFTTQVVEPLAEVLQSADKSAAINIVGTSGREDGSDSGSHHERLKKEYQASKKRLESGFDYLEQRLTEVVPGYVRGGMEMDQRFKVGLLRVGASNLPNSGYPLNESQRRENRRVVFSLTVFDFAGDAPKGGSQAHAVDVMVHDEAAGAEAEVRFASVPEPGEIIALAAWNDTVASYAVIRVWHAESEQFQRLYVPHIAIQKVKDD